MSREAMGFFKLENIEINPDWTNFNLKTEKRYTYPTSFRILWLFWVLAITIWKI